MSQFHLPQDLESVSPSEFARFRGFLASHTITETEIGGAAVSYSVSGQGEKALLTFAGGWGGIEILYETVLGFETLNRVVVIDISPFGDPNEMVDAIDHILGREGLEKVVVVGQSLAGILAQLYFRRRSERVLGLVLTNTLSPRPERCRRWPLLLFKCLPMSLIRSLVLRKMARIERLTEEIPPSVEMRRRFVRALLLPSVEHAFTRKRIERILRLAWHFNLEGPYGPSEFSDWAGQVLLVTSEDDPYHEDAKTLASTLPATELFELPSGFGHVAPQIHLEQFHAGIQAFVERLPGCH